MILNIFGKKRIIDIKENKTILQLLQDEGIYLSATCGGRGDCGKCKIKVLTGNLQITKEDRKFFSKKELQAGFRLACTAFPQKDLEVFIESSEKEYSIISGFNKKITKINHGYQIIKLNLDKVDWNKNKSLSSVIKDNPSLNSSYSLSAKALRAMSGILADCKHDNCLLMIKDKEIVDVFCDESYKIYGIAIDIGTTTLSFNLIDLEKGDIIGSHSRLNSQGIYGADIISRIQYAASGKLQELQDRIKTDILISISELLKGKEIDNRFIYEMAISGNTVMLHLLLGLYPELLGRSPFVAVNLDLLELKFYEIFAKDILDCKVAILPGIGIFVGADTTAGILYHDIFKTEKVNLLLDIGTNGEIAIGNKDFILTTATAAGPALEGGNISCGIGSVPGAIATIKYDGHNFRWETIANKEPIGICGSGVIDIIGEGLKHGLIDKTGLLKDDLIEQGITVYTDDQGRRLGINQKDIREIQLAKSAIRAGIEILIGKYGTNFDDIKQVYLAGGFGSNIQVDNMIKIGLIPQELGKKIYISGNSSLGGSVKYLLDKTSKESLNTIKEKSRAINLSSDSEFNELFIKYMYF